MTYDDAYKITNSQTSTNDSRRTTGAYYWLGSALSNDHDLWCVNSSGQVSNRYGAYCYGVRPVVSLKSGVYAVSGDGSESDPYILGK